MRKVDLKALTIPSALSFWACVLMVGQGRRGDNDGCRYHTLSTSAVPGCADTHDIGEEMTILHPHFQVLVVDGKRNTVNVKALLLLISKITVQNFVYISEYLA